MQSSGYAALFLGLLAGAEGGLRLQGSDQKAKELIPIPLYQMALGKNNIHSVPLDLLAKENPLRSANGQKIMEWVETHVKTEGQMSDTKLWPELSTKGTWDTGLEDPHVHVVSMKPSLERRHGFVQRFAKLGLKLSEGSTHWAMGINASKVPMLLRNPNKAAAEGAEKWWNSAENLGAVGCLMAHIRVFREHAKRCPTCDLMVFEDDVDFHPNFQKFFTEFYNSLPEQLPNHWNVMKPIGLLHLGGDAFWTKPERETPTYFQIDSASRTWGYVVKAHAVKPLLNVLVALDGEQNESIDQVLGGEGQMVRVAPKFPLVLPAACAGNSLTAANPEADNNDAIANCERSGRAANWRAACWGHTYVSPEKLSCAPQTALLSSATR